ncbi:flippase [Natronococcus jeotgali]|uniref:Polysaccharide biosynthesis protein n=1 Tax=Natronococcus jeotgali DSM 18795 TaxID=1227498 RepID=L9X1Y4_9EURY|nr:flippase [Natronococcus jeotgali]ELY55784.1 polysaccharide biosynthesis protein [Natronococcus jeotgali DSM 18795]
MELTQTLISRFKSEFLGRISGNIASAILIVALARLLNPDSYGLLFLTISILTVAKTFSKLGVAKSSARYISEYKEKNHGQINHILRFSMIFNIGTAALTIIIFLIISPIIISLVNEPRIGGFLFIGAVYILFGTLTTYSRIVLQGFEDISSSSLILVIDRMTRLFFSVGLVLLGYGAIGGLLGYLAGVLLASSVGLLILYRDYYTKGGSEIAMESGLKRRIVEYSLPLTATDTADRIDKEFDTILIGFFLSPIFVSYYAISKQVIRFLGTPATALGFVISPTFGAQKASGNLDSVRQMYYKSLINSLLLYVPMAAGLVIVSKDFLKIVFGNDYAGATLVLQIMCGYTILQAITRITSNGLDFLGRAKIRAWSKIITAVLNVLLNILLIPFFGVEGAAIATLLSYGAYTMSTLYIMHIDVGINIRNFISDLMKIVLITSILSIVIITAVDQVAGIYTLIIGGISGLLTWLLLIISFGYVDSEDLKGVYSL